jgi:glutathione S-transferase
MRLHDYPASANCYKVRLLLALLGRPYERVPVDIFAGDTLTDAYAALNPLRETPVLELDDGTTVAQSNAILWLLAEGTPYLPDGPVERALVLQWLFYEQEHVMGGAGGVRFRSVTGRPVPDSARRRGEQGLALLDRHLDGRSWVVGDGPTIADLSLYGYGHVAGEAGYDLAAYPSLQAWLRRVESLPGFVGDLQPYPANARPGASRSIYD